MRRSLLVLASVLILSPALHAQSASVGASYTLLSLTHPDEMPHGFGGWLAWDSASTGPVGGLDVGVNVFPEDHPIIGRQAQALAGARAGIRTDRFGAFARVRPGVLHFTERFFAPDTVCILIFPTPESCLTDSNNFVLDLGGTLEVYATRRSVIRVDLGDTLIRFARADRDPAWKHNLQFAAGAGFRF